MPDNRILTSCLAVSILLHVAASVFLAVVPIGTRRAPDVMVVSLADVPRPTEFLPPAPGIVPPARPAPRHAPPRPAVPAGRVPDLPVDAALPPEKEYPVVRPRAEAPPPGNGREPAAEAPRRAPAPTPAPERPQAAARSATPEAPARTRPGKLPSGRDLTPTLGKTLMTLAQNRGLGDREESSGAATASGGKAAPRGEISEEHRSGTRLTALNAPEIQYISYFSSIKRKIELVWQYPYEAAQSGIQGELVIEFVIGRDGKLESATLTQGSGQKILDDEALRALSAAAPFDPIPDQYRIPNLVIRGHFVYEMHQLRLR